MAKQKSYLEQRREMKLNGPKPAKVEKAERIEKGKFFADALKQAPNRCQNCNKALAGTAAINPAAIVAHIIPKGKTAGVSEVATDPRNRVFLCGDCHTNMDNHGCDFIETMKIFPLLKERVAQMWELIPTAKRRRVPACLHPTK